MSDLTKIINPEFSFSYNGKDYQIRKASLRKVIQYQEKVKELTDAKQVGIDYQLVAYCLYLVLKDIEPLLTEEEVLNTVPGDIEILDVLTTLGFLTPSQKELALKAKQLVTDKLTTLSSS